MSLMSEKKFAAGDDMLRGLGRGKFRDRLGDSLTIANLIPPTSKRPNDPQVTESCGELVTW